MVKINFYRSIKETIDSKLNGVFLIFGGVFIVTISLMMFGPKGIMPKQYSKQLERQNLEDLSEEELHTLIDFHRSQKNFDAADHASKYLMLKLDNNESDS